MFSEPNGQRLLQEKGIIMQPTFYALVILEEDGHETFGGAYVNRQRAEDKGRKIGKRYEIRPAFLS
jgi:hypothetical protein